LQKTTRQIEAEFGVQNSARNSRQIKAAGPLHWLEKVIYNYSVPMQEVTFQAS
jgi:hypothetical protein